MSVKRATKPGVNQEIIITAPNFKVLSTTIVGTSIFVSNNFSQEAIDLMKTEMEKGAKAKTSKGNRAAKDFNAGYLGSMHMSEDGWFGIPATAFRAAMIRTCSVKGIEMTRAKMCFFIEADGYEKDRGTPLVRVTKGEPERFDSYVRNATGVADIRARARLAAGWECVLRVRYDADLFSATTVANLVQHAGISVGIGAGRPFSTMSAGQGWGTFEIQGSADGDSEDKSPSETAQAKQFDQLLSETDEPISRRHAG